MKTLVRTCPYCGKVIQVMIEDTNELPDDIPPVPCESCHAKFVRQNKVPVWGIYKDPKCISSNYFFITRDDLPTVALQKMADDSGFLILHQETFENHLRQLVKDGKEKEIRSIINVN